MEFKRPNEWQEVKFEELVGVAHTGLVRSAKEQSSERQYNYLKMNNLNVDGSFTLRDLTKVDASESEVEKNTLKSGDFLFNTRNSVELVGKCGVFKDETDTPMLFNNNLLKVNFLLMKPEVVAAWLNSPLGKRQLRSITSATTSVAAIYQKQLMKLDIPIPPLAEQKVIADKLDKLLAKVDSIKARLDAVPDTLKRFRQSVLAAAVSGKLTEVWRTNKELKSASVILKELSVVRETTFQEEIQNGNKETKRLQTKVKKHAPEFPEVELPDSWEWTSFMSSMERVVDCHNKTAPYIEKGIPLIRTPDIRDGKISLDGAKYISQETYDYWSRRCPPKSGDIIFTREAPMGEAGIVPEGTTLCMGQRMMLLRPVTEFVNPSYVLLNILSLDFQQRMQESAIGTGVKHLRVADVEGLTYPLAPFEEQTEIVRRVEQLFAYADKVEAEVNAAQERVNKLTPSILAKAFRGELTAKWREQNPDLISGENSAEALLAKIKAEREKLKPKKKTRTKK